MTPSKESPESEAQTANAATVAALEAELRAAVARLKHEVEPAVIYFPGLTFACPVDSE